jgi:hypothetical protein
MRTACRSIFDNGDLGLGVAHDHVIIIDHSAVGVPDHEQACDHEQKQSF